MNVHVGMSTAATTALLSAALAIAAVPIAARADITAATAPSNGPVAGDQGSPPSGTEHGAVRGQEGQDRQEMRIVELHRRLKVSPAQGPQWDNFAQIIRDNAREMRETIARTTTSREHTAVEDMRAYAAMMTLHADGLRKLVPAFEALYDVMAPEQRRTADAVFRQYARQVPRRMSRG